MEPVSRVLPGAVEAILRRAPLSDDKVAFAWRVTVGPAVDRATTIELRDGVLYVRPRDPAWQREIERSVELIRRRLGALLGEDLVRWIRIERG